ncbi:MAG: chromosome segregation protein SMC [Blastocatellia bacterium]|nr:chromosome segregation protein SMC [Blastocatellia bacterium]
MFKLQRLEITGFKSFADYTEIVFTGNGITAVVGPNGCGKSNVSDAISWVLGEQRAKTLRGGEMKDVVFQGSRNRKPGGMAEVVLHLVRDDETFDIDENELEDIDETLSALDETAVDVDALEAETIDETVVTEAVGETADAHAEANGFHADEFEVEKVQAAQVGSVQTVERTIKTKRHWRPRAFALDFAPGEAVSVTRRLYLSGESEYELNGKTCRLRDIQDLFAGTGLSGAHYAIIEQGRIGQILSAKPSDRRNLIEEAAGISKFRTRQRAAETRLESARTNLGRISDIVSEIEKQANSLRRQAGKTRRYIVLQEEFRVLLRQLFAAEGSYLSTAIESFEKQLAEAIELEKSFAVKVAEQEESFREATQRARFVEETLAEIRRQHADNALERDRAEREHRYQAEQIVNLNNRSESIRGEIEAIEQRLKLIESELERLNDEDEAESAEADASRQILLEAEKQYALKLDDARKIEDELEAHRADLMKQTAGVGRFDEIARQLEANAERLTERLHGLEREAERAAEAYELFVKEAGELEASQIADTAKLESLQAEKTELIAGTSAAREKLRGSEESLRNLEAEQLKTRNRRDTLSELDENRAVYAPQIQKLFAAQEQIGVRLAGVLADFLNVDERYEIAIESLFGHRLQTVLVDSIEDAKTVTAWLERNAIGRIAILAAPSLSGARTQQTAFDPVVANVLGVSHDLLAKLNEVFPREMAARIVDSARDADLTSGETFVTLSGSVVTPAGLFITGREVTGDQPNASLLAFKRELSGLGTTLIALDEEILRARAISDEDGRVLASFEEKTVDLQSLIIKVERGLHGLDIQRSTTRQEIDRADRHKKVIAEEQRQTVEELEQVRVRTSEAAENRSEAERLRNDAHNEVERINALLAAARAKSDEENAAVNEKRTLAATSGERRRSVQSALRRVENEQKELESRSALQTLELTEIDAKTGGLRESTASIADRIAGAETQKSVEETEIAAAVGEVTEARQTADAMSTELADLNHRSADALNERAAIEVRQTEAVTRLKNVNEKCSQDLNTQLAALIESEALPDEFDLGACRENVDDLRNKLEGFGAINMLAVEELTEAEERLLFLTSQRQDIIDSIASAEEALREIKERSRAKFRDAFEAINTNFIEFFHELFGGGKGEMTLLENDDILEAGIEVVAQPPGKRLQNILLLSGGEKAMTAIALVLAIFRYRPSPFCLLDEVDAPLDDANVGRFVNKIADMSEKTQFIVITHNKRTMEAARALYGVTMQEAGVSKVVSVKFE